MENRNVFISYKSEEISEADWVRNMLTNSGISCWMAPSCIPGGSSYASEIPRAIKNCRVFVLILSEKAQRSKWVAKEVDLAINEGKIIMPFMLENCSLENEFNFYLTNVQRYAAYEDRTGAINKMIGEIKEVLGIKGGAGYDPYRFFTPTGSYSGTRPEAGPAKAPQTPPPQTPPPQKPPQAAPNVGMGTAPQTQGGAGGTAPFANPFTYTGASGGTTVNYTANVPQKKKRWVFIILTVFFYIMTFAALIDVVESYSFEILGNIGTLVFVTVLAIMFHVLARSPKQLPNILGKPFGMKKSTFVIIMLAVAFGVGIICNSINNFVFSYILYDSFYGY